MRSLLQLFSLAPCVARPCADTPARLAGRSAAWLAPHHKSIHPNPALRAHIHCAACISASPPLCAQAHRLIMARATSPSSHALGSSPDNRGSSSSRRSSRRRGSRPSSSRRSTSLSTVAREATAQRRMAAAAAARLHALGPRTGGDRSAVRRPLPPRYGGALRHARRANPRVPDLSILQRCNRTRGLCGRRVRRP